MVREARRGTALADRDAVRARVESDQRFLGYPFEFFKILAPLVESNSFPAVSSGPSGLSPPRTSPTPGERVPEISFRSAHVEPYPESVGIPRRFAQRLFGKKTYDPKLLVLNSSKLLGAAPPRLPQEGDAHDGAGAPLRAETDRRRRGPL